MRSMIYPVPLAAIDIGSNAIRLILGELDQHGDVRTVKRVRESVRLGKDAFSGTGEISEKTIDRAVASFRKFRGILKDKGVTYVRAVATSALRDAKNRNDFVAKIKDASGITIQIIDGVEEGRLIYSAIASRLDLSEENSLLIDIGGGSAEITYTSEGQIRGTQTFKLGTVRMLQLLEDKGLKEKHLKGLIQERMGEVTSFIKDVVKKDELDSAVGTGGNLECLGKLRVALLNRTSMFTMSRNELGSLIEHLSGMSYKERVQFLRLRPDRADVIVPAALVTHAIMLAADIDVMNVPYVGLRDGILWDLAAQIQHD